MPEQDFYVYLEKIIKENQVLELSDSYFIICQNENITRSDIADSIYKDCGLKGLEDYVRKSPITNFNDADNKTFLWATYILWENYIRVTLDDESASWCIKE